VAQEEIELKLLLNKQGYQSILHLYPGDWSLKIQINHYYDTNDLFYHGHGCTLRWRLEDGKGYLTVKIRRVIGASGISRALEWESPVGLHNLNPEAPEEIRELVQQWTDFPEDWKIRLKDLRLMGAIENRRMSLRRPQGLTFELDRTQYPSGALGYELEVERISSLEAEKLKKGLRKEGISFQLPQEGKRTRFLRDLGLLR
jgi:uncharacterized protein YjbK